MILARLGTTGLSVGPAVVGIGVGWEESVGDNVGISVGLIGSGVCPYIACWCLKTGARQRKVCQRNDDKEEKQQMSPPSNNNIHTNSILTTKGAPVGVPGVKVGLSVGSGVASTGLNVGNWVMGANVGGVNVGVCVGTLGHFSSANTSISPYKLYGLHGKRS